MNLLYITYDGVSDFVAKSQVIPFLERLPKIGIDVTLLSFEKRNEQKDSYRLDMKKKGIYWISKRYHKTPAVFATLFDIFVGIISSIAIVRSKNIGVTHARGYISALIGFVLKKIFSARLIFDMRGFWPDEKVDAGRWKKDGILYFIFKKIEKLLLTSTDEIIVLTEAARKYILEKFKIKCEMKVIPCLVDISLFEKIFNSLLCNKNNLIGRKVILYAGNLGTFYNLEKMLDFFKLMNKKDKTSFLWILSKYSKDVIKESAGKKGIGSSDYGVDVLDYDDMPKAFSTAYASLMFYNRKLSNKGCCPIKFTESLACGTPVIINSGIGDCDKIIENNKVGAVIQDFSEEEYEKAISYIDRLMEEKDLTTSRCKKIAEEKFSLDKGVAKCVEIYNNMEGK